MNTFTALTQAMALPLIPPAAYDDAATAGTGIDVVDYEGVVIAILHAALGTDEDPGPTLDVALEECTDGQAGGDVDAEAIEGVMQGQTYHLLHHHVTAVVVTDGVETTYDVDDDYTVDAVTGQISIVVGGAIEDESDIEVDYTYADMYVPIDDAEFDQVTDAAGAGLQIIQLNITNRNRYLRAVPTITGTSPAFVYGVEFLGLKKAS
jgi:hypothetical protein